MGKLFCVEKFKELPDLLNIFYMQPTTPTTTHPPQGCLTCKDSQCILHVM